MTNSVAGVYAITAPNGKGYIGSSVNVRKRWNTHRYHLRRGEHGNKHLQNSFDKYGEESFRFEVLLICDAENILFYEQRFIDRFDPEFNVYRTAGSPRNYKHTPEAIERIRQASINSHKFMPKEQANARDEKIRASKLGRKREPFNDEWRRKMSESRRRFLANT